VGGHPQSVAVDATKKLLYVADALEGSLSIIDLSSHRIVEKRQVNGRPYALSVDRQTRQVFAATIGSTPYAELTIH
jgi:DNA-binding beta-propeller fold protein YncE